MSSSGCPACVVPSLDGHLIISVARGLELLPELISGLALMTSVLSLAVSILSHRAAGPKVKLLSHTFLVRGRELWLEVRVANAGRGEVGLDGASCDVLGPTLSLLPHRLRSGSSVVLTFRALLRRDLASVGGVTVSLGLGSGHSIVEQLRFTEREQLDLGVALVHPGWGVRGKWIPPSQEEI